jgi:hypothetical protein
LSTTLAPPTAGRRSQECRQTAACSSAARTVRQVGASMATQFAHDRGAFVLAAIRGIYWAIPPGNRCSRAVTVARLRPD